MRPKFNLATLFLVISVVAVLLAVRRAHQNALEKQRMVLEDLEQFGTLASWNSDGIWSLEFQSVTRMLEDHHLAKLEALPELWAIDLRNTKITNQGLRHVAGLNNIRWITLPDTGVTDAVVTELQEQRPDLEIVRFRQGARN